MLRTGAAGRVIPAGFVGLSTELYAIPSFAGEDPNALNPAFLQLVRNLTPGARPVIRLGGDSTDWVWWPVPHTKTPPGIRYTLTPRWMQITKAFVKATNARENPRNTLTALPSSKSFSQRSTLSLEIGIYTLRPLTLEVSTQA